MKNFTKQLLGKAKKYNHFLRQLIKLNYFWSNEYKPISLKFIQEKTGLKYPTIRKYLHLIYEDLNRISGDTNNNKNTITKI